MGRRVAVFILLLAYMAVAALVYTNFEPWSFLDSFYFCLISLLVSVQLPLLPSPSSSPFVGRHEVEEAPRDTANTPRPSPSPSVLPLLLPCLPPSKEEARNRGRSMDRPKSWKGREGKRKKKRKGRRTRLNPSRSLVDLHSSRLARPSSPTQSPLEELLLGMLADSRIRRYVSLGGSGVHGRLHLLHLPRFLLFNTNTLQVSSS